MVDWRASLAGVATALGIGVSWWSPDLLTPLALIGVGATLVHPALRRTVDGRTCVIAVALLAVLAIKDMAWPGPWTTALQAISPGAATMVIRRQPDLAAGLHAIAALGALLLVWGPLAALRDHASLLRGATRAATWTTAALALAVLLHPVDAASYGKLFQLGQVANRNHAGGAIALGAVIALGHAFGTRRPLDRISALACALVTSAAVFSIGSRGALLALATGAGVLAGRQIAKDLRGRLAIGALAVVALLFAAGTPLGRLVESGGAYRLELAHATLRALSHAAWGGFGTGGFAAGFALFGGHLPAEGMHVYHPDSSWLLLAAEWGVIGVIAVVLAARALARRAPTAPPLAFAICAAWAVAATADISLHRPSLLMLGWPFLAIAFGRTTTCPLGRIATTAVLLGVTGLLGLRAFPSRPPEARPLAADARHELGNQALVAGETKLAAMHYLVAAALEPAHTDAQFARALALTTCDPALALPLWQRLFTGADLRGHTLLGEAANRFPKLDCRYWSAALGARDDLWPLVADSDHAGAQSLYERWRSAQKRALSPPLAALGAIARWGTEGELEAWLRLDPPIDDPTVLKGAVLLRERRRDDLAWLWLAHRFPAPPRPQGTYDVVLAARVAAFPDDRVAAARLLASMPSGDSRLALLRRLTAGPNTPASFQVALAHELKAQGRRDEATSALISAARATASSR